jgi:hypothetical protein
VSLAYRAQVCAEEGCDPKVGDPLAPEVADPHDVGLPAPYSPEMGRLANRLELTRDDPPPTELSGWDKAAW